MDAFLPSEFQSFQNLLIALGLGLLVGLQREWVESPLGGIRSFSLVSMLGSIAAVLSKDGEVWMISLGFVGIALMLVLGQFLLLKNPDQKKVHDLVTHFSFLLVYCIGVMTQTGHVTLAAAASGILAFTLHKKSELHSMARNFNKDELKSVMQFVLIILVIFPMIPDETYGPRGSLNPHNIWLMVVLIVGISLTGYIIYKFFGKRAGILATGILGGMVSSTATTITSAKTAKNDEHKNYFSIIILLSWATLYGRVAFELLVMAPGFNSLYLPLGIMTLISLAPIIWLYFRTKRTFTKDEISYKPTGLRMAVTFAGLYAVILFMSSYLKEEFGGSGLLLLGFLSGAVDVNAITLSTARLISIKSLDPEEGHKIILMAILSNNFFKGLIVSSIGGRKLFKIILVPWLLTLVALIILIFLS